MVANDPSLGQRIEDAQTAAAAGTRRPTLIGLLEHRKTREQIAQALPRGVDPDRFMRVVAIELRRNPDLLETTPQSFLGALLEASSLGLEPGPLGHCYLLPFRNRELDVMECQLILGYKGLIDLARRSGNIVNIVAREVCEKDQFDFCYGLDEKLEHRPFMGEDRGKPLAYYGVAHYVGGGHLMMALSKADVERYRARSRAKNRGPWVSDYQAMALKTVIRRMATFLPLSVQAATAIALDQERDEGYGLGSGAVDATILAAVEPEDGSAERNTIEGSAQPPKRLESADPETGEDEFQL